ncbi:hypothetical protein L345_18280, partial [Ophiophagus hannah]
MQSLAWVGLASSGEKKQEHLISAGLKAKMALVQKNRPDFFASCPKTLSVLCPWATRSFRRSPAPRSLVTRLALIDNAEGCSGPRAEGFLLFLLPRTLEERAQRLFSTKGKSLEALDPSLFAKNPKAKGSKR